MRDDSKPSKKQKGGKKSKQGAVEDLKSELKTDMHTVPLEELYERLATNPECGLSAAEAAARLQRDGPNALKPPKQTPQFVKWLRNTFQGFGLLMFIGGILCLLSFIASLAENQFNIELADRGNLVLGVVLLAVVLITGTFSYFQEFRSEKVMEKFLSMLPQRTSAVRDGERVEVDVINLVVGDIVHVKGGDKVPADIRILQSSSFKVDNSSLTGEAEPQTRVPQATHENPMETKNLAFFSSNAVEGSCVGVVVHVGDGTVLGRIAGLASGLGSKKSTLRAELDRFVYIITVIAFLDGLLLFIVGLIRGYPILEAILIFIAIIVANVPEGILAQITLADNPDYPHRGNYKETIEWRALANVAALCSRAEFKPNQPADRPLKERECIGDASEVAILQFMEYEFGDVVAYRKRWPKVAEIPFNSTNKFHLSIHKIDENDPKRNNGFNYLLLMKGAPERILDRSDSILHNGNEEHMTEDWKSRFVQAYEELGGHGERVLGFADLYLSADQYPDEFDFNTEEPNFPMKNLRFVGLISLIDPPRPQVPTAVAKCRSAGIQVIMVTGDHPITAKAIARSVGIISQNSKTKEDIEEDEKRLSRDPSATSLASNALTTSMASNALTTSMASNTLTTSMGKSDSRANLMPDRSSDRHEVHLNMNGQKQASRTPNATVIAGSALKEMNESQIDAVLRDFKEIVFARTSPQQKLLIVEGNQRAGKIVGVTGDGVNDSPALKKANIGIAMGITGSEVSKEAANMVLLDDNFATIVSGIEEGRALFDNLKKSIGYVLTHNMAELFAFFVWFFLSLPAPLGAITVLLIELGTDMVPSIMFAYDPPELGIMERPPRDPRRDRMVSMKLLLWCYTFTGLIEGIGSMVPYFIIMGDNGFHFQTIFFTSLNFESEYVNDFVDSYGQQWTYEQRTRLEHLAWSGYFFGLMEIQWGNLLVKRTRRTSMLEKGIDNDGVTFALFFETLLAVLLVYVPFLNYVLYTQPLSFRWVLCSFPFTLWFIISDEIRKAIIRRWPNGHIKKLTEY